MLKKRLIGVVTVKNGWAVQSFGYNRYLPLGRPELLVENLDRWGADEILLQCIDRSTMHLGPDFNVLQNINSLGISTPLIYSGGIRDADDAKKVISKGADRIMIDYAFRNNPGAAKSIALNLGAQALIINLSLRNTKSSILKFNYETGMETPLMKYINGLEISWCSEILVTDWSNEGNYNAFGIDISRIVKVIDKPILCFGGISTAKQMKRLLDIPAVVGVGVGNFLNYKEHAFQAFKECLIDLDLRAPHYEENQLV